MIDGQGSTAAKIEAEPKCCAHHAAAVGAGGPGGPGGPGATMGYLMNLYGAGQCEENYLIELYQKCAGGAPNCQ